MTHYAKRIGIVACEAKKLAGYFPTASEPHLVPTELPFTPDDQLLVNELRRRGHSVSPVIWGAPVAGLARDIDILVFRSPWDYMDTPANAESFGRWLGDLAKCGPRAQNDAGLMLWLLDKRYLLDFERAGVRIVPTDLIDSDRTFSLEERVRELGSLIVKPVVSAAGKGLEKISTPAEARALQNRIERSRARGEAFLVQPFIESIQNIGEWSLIYIAGRYSHAVLKRPAAGKILCQAEQGGSLDFGQAPREAIEFCDDMIAKLPAALRGSSYGQLAGSATPLYLRIDVLQTAEGPALSECEGVEPELFFRARPESVNLFCEALFSPCGRSPLAGHPEILPEA